METNRKKWRHSGCSHFSIWATPVGSNFSPLCRYNPLPSYASPPLFGVSSFSPKDNFSGMRREIGPKLGIRFLLPDGWYCNFPTEPNFGYSPQKSV